MLSYQVRVEIEGVENGVVEFKNVTYDGMHPEKPYFYMFRFLDETQIEYPIGRILKLEYGQDKTRCIEYWKMQELKE